MSAPFVGAFSLRVGAERVTMGGGPLGGSALIARGVQEAKKDVALKPESMALVVEGMFAFSPIDRYYRSRGSPPRRRLMG